MITNTRSKALTEEQIFALAAAFFRGKLRLRLSDVAKAVSMPEQSLRNALARGTLRLRPIHEGRAVYFSTIELAQLISNNESLIFQPKRGRPRASIHVEFGSAL